MTTTETVADVMADFKNSLAGSNVLKYWHDRIESALASAEPVAFLLTGGKLFSDRVVMGKGEAEKAIGARKDGSVAVPLVAASFVSTPVEATQAVSTNDADSGSYGASPNTHAKPAAKVEAPDLVLQLLAAGGFVDPAKVEQAREIIAGCTRTPASVPDGMVGRMLDGDFTKNTITFEMQGEYILAAGTYRITPERTPPTNQEGAAP